MSRQFFQTLSVQDLDAVAVNGDQLRFLQLSQGPTCARKPLAIGSKINVHYNIGHRLAVQGDTVSHDDKYLVAMTKWTTDFKKKRYIECAYWQ